MTAWMTVMEVGAVVAEWSNGLIAQAPESWMLVVWGALLLLVGQRVRSRMNAPHTSDATLLAGIDTRRTRPAAG